MGKIVWDNTRSESSNNKIVWDSGITWDNDQEASALAAFGKSAVGSAIPATAGLAGATAAITAGAPLITASGPAAPLTAVGLGLVGGFAGAYGGEKLQEAAIAPNIPEDLKQALGFGEQQRAAETAQHPYASFAGQLAPNLAFFRPGAIAPLLSKEGNVIMSPMAQRSAMAGAGGAIEAGQEYLTTGEVDPAKVAMAAAFQGIAATPTKLGSKLGKFGEPTKAIEEELKLPEGFGEERIKQAHSFIKNDLKKIEVEIADLEIKKKQADLVGTDQEKVIVDEALKAKVEEKNILRDKFAVLNKHLGIEDTLNTPHATVEYAKGSKTSSDDIPEVRYQKLLETQQKAEEVKLQQTTQELQSIDPNTTDPLTLNRINELKDAVQEHQDNLDIIRQKQESNSVVLFERKVKTPSLWKQVPNTKGVYLESTLDSFVTPDGKQVRTKLSHFLESFVSKLGLGDHKLVVGSDLFRTGETSGSTRIVGDTTYVSLNREQIHYRFSQMLDAYPDMKNIYNNMSAKDQINFRTAVVLAHELGHAFWYRSAHSYFKNPHQLQKLGDWYVNWVKKQVAENKTDYRTTAKIFPEHFLFDDTFVKGPLSFKEYLAQVVARELILKSNLYAVKTKTGDFTYKTESNLYLQSILGKFIRGFKEMMQELLQSFGLNPYKIIGNREINPKTFDGAVNKMMQDIIKENEATTKMGETIFTYMENRGNVFGAGRTLQDTKRSLQMMSVWSKEPDNMIDPNIMGNVPLSAKEALNKTSKDIGPVSSKFLFNSFGKMQNASQWGIYADSPLLRYTYSVIRNAQETAIQFHNKLWYGSSQPKSQKWVGPFTSLKQIENADTPSLLLRKSSDLDKHAVLQVFQKGFENKYDYNTSLRTFGGNLTESQKQLFTSLSKMFKQQWSDIVSQQKRMGKTNILPYREGWFPSVRLGDWYVELTSQGIGVHRQHFRTEEQAKIFADKFNGLKDKQGLEVSIPLQKDKNTAWDSVEFLYSKIHDVLEAKGFKTSIQEIEKLMEKLSSTGGTLGKHHVERFNIPGYKGSELFKNREELGKSFGEAIENSVNEYSNSLRNMIINHGMSEFNSIKDTYQKNIPNTLEAVQLLEDVAKNNINVLTEGLDNAIVRNVDKLAATMGRTMGKKDYFPENSAFQRGNGVLSNLFYTWSLTLRPGFWLANLLTSPMSLRLMFREDNLFRAMASAGYGTMRLMRPDAEFKHAVSWVANNTNTFHPQFINDLNKLPLVGATHSEWVKKTTEFFTGQSIASASDSFSRYWTFSMMFEHYRKQGLTGQKLWLKAAEATDNAMVQYGRAEKAPIFQKMGIVGEMVSPLQTFSQAQIGNLISDIVSLAKHKDARSLAAASSTFMITMLMAGAIGMPLVAEYEVLRLALEKLGLLEKGQYSVMHWALSGDNRIASHGIFAETGYDLASSMRFNPILRGITEGQTGVIDMMPAVSWVAQMTKAGETVIRARVAKDVPEAELRTAKLQLTPGWYKGVVDDLMFNAANRKFVPSYGKAAASVPQTKEERIASYLGTRTISTATEKARKKLVKTAQDQRTESIHRKVQLLMDAYNRNDSKASSELITKLVKDDYVDPRQLPAMIKEQIMLQNIPEYEREMYGTTGPKSLGAFWKYQQYQNFEEENQ